MSRPSGGVPSSSASPQSSWSHRPQTARHLAAVRVLLELGADPARPTVNSWRADRVARHHKQDAAAELIVRARNPR